MSLNPPGQQQGNRLDNRFTRHTIATISVLLAICLLLCLLALELFLRTFSCLGNSPFYEISPLYDYRLKPNQIIEPRSGIGFLYDARIIINYLGLRGAAEWDPNPAGKILLLGDSATYGGSMLPMPRFSFR